MLADEEWEQRQITAVLEGCYEVMKTPGLSNLCKSEPENLTDMLTDEEWEQIQKAMVPEGYYEEWEQRQISTRICYIGP